MSYDQAAALLCCVLVVVVAKQNSKLSQRTGRCSVQ